RIRRWLVGGRRVGRRRVSAGRRVGRRLRRRPVGRGSRGGAVRRRRRATAGRGGRFGRLRPAVVRLTVLRLTGGGGAHVGLLSRGFQPIGRGATRRIGWCGSDP